MASQAARACLSWRLSALLIVDAPKGDLDELCMLFNGEAKLGDPAAKLSAGWLDGQNAGATVEPSAKAPS